MFQNANLHSEIEDEIFDDDDFYHKLLRDYIERKTADISDPTQLSKYVIISNKIGLFKGFFSNFLFIYLFFTENG